MDLVIAVCVWIIGPLGIMLARPECRGNVVRGSPRCKHCGAMLTTPSSAEPAAPPMSDRDRQRPVWQTFRAPRPGEKGK